MSAAAWRDIEADLESMATHFRSAVAIHERNAYDAPGLDGYMASMAMLHAMQSGYTSAEAAMVRLLDLLEEDRPVGPDWHQVLIRRLSQPLEGELARPALLSEGLALAMQNARGFRHVAMHVYERIDVDRFPAAVEAASLIVDELPAAVQRFRSLVDR